MMNYNNEDIRCGVFMEVRVNCNYVDYCMEEKGYNLKNFNYINEEKREMFWKLYNKEISNYHIIEDEILIETYLKIAKELDIEIKNEEEENDKCVICEGTEDELYYELHNIHNIKDDDDIELMCKECIDEKIESDEIYFDKYYKNYYKTYKVNCNICKKTLLNTEVADMYLYDDETKETSEIVNMCNDCYHNEDNKIEYLNNPWYAVQYGMIKKSNECNKKENKKRKTKLIIKK